MPLTLFPFFLLVWVIAIVSSLATLRFVRRHEVPRGTLRLAALAPGLAALGGSLFFDGLVHGFSLLVGAVGTLAGLTGLAVLLFATRRAGLQPRVTPFALSEPHDDGERSSSSFDL